MSAAGEAKDKEDVLASGAKPRLEERVRERGWQPSSLCREFAMLDATAARRRAIGRSRHATHHKPNWSREAAMSALTYPKGELAPKRQARRIVP